MGFIWAKVFKNGASEIYRRQPLKNLKWYGHTLTHIILEEEKFDWKTYLLFDEEKLEVGVEVDDAVEEVRHLLFIAIDFHSFGSYLQSRTKYLEQNGVIQ